ncbi:coiled-coil domain-containing protein [Helicobacter cappadocius]|uniref:Uncharacterized protein n=1 Tax=Helicobacter cappadocius TaxID=3063998 RepID=A0AA90PT06_9HELI|nr:MULTISPECIES: hypothetical protein [unclassified Helicobacter]MDO7252861.1 hypothetical protein [Helicobacter sp. faydin-H75]MDP2538904.1 hypothetical protein [Helicobacter sp. faydin-H76]
MDCSLLYAITLDKLEQGFIQSRNMIEFNQNIIANLSSELKKILQEHSLTSNEKDCKEHVRKAIADFYRKNGMGTFIRFDKDKNIEVSTVVKDPQNNLCVMFLSRWLEENKKKFRSKTGDTNETLSQEEFNMIIEYAKMCVDFNNDLLFRDIVRNAIRKTFNLNSRDGLFFTPLGAYFKIFDFKFVKLSNEIRSVQKLNSARLLDDGDRLKINAYLKKYDVDKMIIDSIDYVLNTKTHLEGMSNISFTKNFLFFVAQDFRSHLEKILDGKIPSILQTCFVEEKIRSYKNIIFDKVANFVLQMVYNGSSSARDFIAFYNGQTVQNEGREIIIPPITDAKGERWSLEKIENTLTQKHQIQAKIDSLKENQKKINEVISFIEKGISKIQTEIDEKNKLIEKIDSIYEGKKKQIHNIKENDKNIQKETISLGLGKYLEEKKTILTQIEELNLQINQKKQKKLECAQEQKNIQDAIETQVEENQIKFIQYDMLVSALSGAIGGVKLEY